MAAPTKKALLSFSENWEAATKLLLAPLVDLDVYVGLEMCDPNADYPRERIELEFEEGDAEEQRYRSDDDPDSSDWVVLNGTINFRVITYRPDDEYTPLAAIKTRHRGYVSTIREMMEQDGINYTETETPWYYLLEAKPLAPTFDSDEDFGDMTTFPYSFQFSIRPDAWPVDA